MACSVMTEMASLDENVQKFIEKASGLYLTHRVILESENELKEAVFGSLYSILKAKDVTIKWRFIKEYNGLHFVKDYIMHDFSQKLKR